MDWPALWHEAALLLGRWWPTLHPRSGCDRCLLGSAGCSVVFKTWFRLIWQIPCGAVTTWSNFSKILITDIPFAGPLGWDVGRLLWVPTLIYIPTQPLYVYNIMLYWSALWRHSTVYHLRWIGLYMCPDEPRVETNPCGHSHFSYFSSVHYA